MTTSIRSQRQASTTFALGGVTAPRPKGAFYVMFRRGEFSQGISYWEKDLGFLIKTVTNPTVTPKVEEINQYNKKRQVYTGYNFAPVTIALYDTADAMALRMWNEYASYYFADFTQDPNNYLYDMVPQSSQSTMLGDAIGYGYQPRPLRGDGLDSLNSNSQFFFSSIDVYQVFRNAYTKFSLLNPKITSWETEELDYESFNPVMHHLQITYEAVIYANNGAPQSIDDDDSLAQVFQDVRLSGDFLDVTGVTSVDITSNGTPIPPQPAPNLFGGSGTPLSGITGIGAGSVKSGLGGVLGTFGSFNFGAGLGSSAQALTGVQPSSLAQLAYSASNNPAVASALNLVSTTANQQPQVIGSQLVTNPIGQNGINPAAYDAAVGAVQGASNTITGTDIGPSVVSGVMAASALTGQSPSAQVSDQGGFSMAPQIYGVVNQSRPAMSQIGYNNQSPDPTFSNANFNYGGSSSGNGQGDETSDDSGDQNLDLGGGASVDSPVPVDL